MRHKSPHSTFLKRGRLNIIAQTLLSHVKFSYLKICITVKHISGNGHRKAFKCIILPKRCPSLKSQAYRELTFKQWQLFSVVLLPCITYMYHRLSYELSVQPHPVFYWYILIVVLGFIEHFSYKCVLHFHHIPSPPSHPSFLSPPLPSKSLSSIDSIACNFMSLTDMSL